MKSLVLLIILYLYSCLPSSSNKKDNGIRLFSALQPISSPVPKLSVKGTLKDASGNPLSFAAVSSSSGINTGLSIHRTPVINSEGLSFTDVDPDLGEVAGKLSLKKAADETGITFYELYWGDANNKALGRIGRFYKTGTNFDYILSQNTKIPSKAARFLVFSGDNSGLIEKPLSLSIQDVKADTISDASGTYTLLVKLEKQSDGKNVSKKVTVTVVKDGEELGTFSFVIPEEIKKDDPPPAVTVEKGNLKITITALEVLDDNSTNTTNIDPNAVSPFSAGGSITTIVQSYESIQLSWPAATGGIPPYQYKLIFSTSNDISTIDSANLKTPSMDWTTSTLSYTISGLGSISTYYFTVLARDSLGNIVQYPVVTASTPACGYCVSTLAGIAGSSGVADGYGTNARLYYPGGIVYDSTGNLYITSNSAHVIQKINLSNNYVSLLAGSSFVTGSSNGIGTNAQFNGPNGITIDSRSGDLYVADTYNQVIRKIDSNGNVSTFAGQMGIPSSTSPYLYNPVSVFLDTLHNILYFGQDAMSSYLRKIDLGTGTISVLIGDGTGGTYDGIGTSAQLYSTGGLTMDSSGNLYFTDPGPGIIRKIDTTSSTTNTIAGSAFVSGSSDGAGTNALFNSPTGIVIGKDGYLYVVDSYNNKIRKIDTRNNTVSTVVGDGSIGSQDGNGTNARFNTPFGIAVDKNGNLYISEYYNHTIRKIIP
ncbi:MAG: SMP-30/gluconolactonase/LRE family protein [Leptospiraceae bacterium]|nr:SMP-30/gluconolactonase/LRE family protein [Leptospiraceae bacterium]MCP5503383.1 SMP-30/gluconolactonase/LRE family protein [Leptospiraceae bacterium]